MIFAPSLLVMNHSQRRPTRRSRISRSSRTAGSRDLPRSWNFARRKQDCFHTRTGILEAVYEQQMRRAEWDRATGRYFQFSDDSRLQTCMVPTTERASLNNGGAHPYPSGI